MQKPYAVIRKAIAPVDGPLDGTTLEGDASDEEDLDMEDLAPAKKRKPGQTPTKPKEAEEDDEEEDGPLFAPDPGVFQTTPKSKTQALSSSPYVPSSAPRDYSSELDPSSPARWEGDDDEDEEDEEREQEQARQAELKRRRERAKQKREAENGARTRHYEVVGVVWKKVVFALRYVLSSTNSCLKLMTLD